MNDDQLLRYSRHINLEQLGYEGQQRIVDSCVAVVGAGGLGSPAALYLAAAGVGTLRLIDFDHVEMTNLQRQIAHTTDAVGSPKVESARQRAAAINPTITIETIEERLDEANAQRLLAGADVVLDCSDHFAVRFAVNDACVALRTPLVSAASIRFEGQISVFDLRDPDSPCYRCLHPQASAPHATESCALSGVLGPVVGLMGTYQALEALKLLGGAGTTLNGRLMLFDALHNDWTQMTLPRRDQCPGCGGAA